MKITQFFLIFFCLSILLALTPIETNAQLGNSGQIFIVNNASDAVDSNEGDGICADANGLCTLRAAIQEANSGAATDVILFSLPDPSVINLTLGELKTTASVAIIGPGARKLTVQRSFNANTPEFRVFNLFRNGIYTVNIARISIKNGKASGGGIYVDYATTARLTEVSISNNSGGLGGAISNTGTTFLIRSLIDSNVSTHQGGGLINGNFDSTATIIDSTITNNSSASGGGIYNNGKMLLVNNTISHNSATTDGSNIANSLDSASVVSVLNTIVGNNNSSTAASLAGPFNSLGNNFISDARESTGFTNGVNNDQVGNNNSIDPLLGNLTDNGGQTNTRALQIGSPAVNTGNNCVSTASCMFPPNNIPFIAYDQRNGYRRLSGTAVDIGAFEAGASAASGELLSYGGGLFGQPGRALGAIAVLTNAATLEKFYSYVGSFGNFNFKNLRRGEFYILQIKSKRAPGFSLRVISLE